MSELNDQLRAYLEQLSKLQRSAHRQFFRGHPANEYRYFSIAEFLLAEGKDMPLSPYQWTEPYDIPKECFSNSAKWAFEADAVTYCEGYTVSPELPVPIHHAWVINRRGKVYDPTLGRRPGSAYFGVSVRTALLQKLVFRNGWYGLFTDGMTITPLVLGTDPDFNYRGTSHAS